MRLLPTLPNLGPAEGSLYTHNTSGEHATKYAGRHTAINTLSRTMLRPLVPENLSDYTHDEFFSLLSTPKTEVVIVDHLYNNGDRAQSLAGFAIAERDATDKYSARSTISRLAVHPELQKRGIASGMIGRILEFAEATELVLDSTKFEVPDWFEASLHRAGFTHRTEDGSPALWALGMMPLHINGEEESGRETLRQMPENWFGVVHLFGNSEAFDHRTELYRHGVKVGIIRRVEGSLDFNDEINSTVSSYDLFDASDNLLDRLDGITEIEAPLHLLNFYSLVAGQPER